MNREELQKLRERRIPSKFKRQMRKGRKKRGRNKKS
jgi:hypothetical protein